jgi:hypothetical protein
LNLQLHVTTLWRDHTRSWHGHTAWKRHGRTGHWHGLSC